MLATIGSNAHRVLVVSGLFLVLSSWPQEPYTATLPFRTVCQIEGDTLSDAVIASLDKAFSEPSILRHVNFDPDVCMSMSEFTYLTDLCPGMPLNAHLMKRALHYIQKKRLFKTLTLTIDRDVDSVDVRIAGIALWTFAKFKIHGVLTGKDMYQRYYLMEPGEPFNQEKHTRSIEHIRDALCRFGYHAATVSTRFVYRQKTKGVMVHSTIDLGKRFSVGAIALEMRLLNDIPTNIIDGLHLEIERKFLKPLKKKIYSRDVVAHQAGELRSFLIQRGFFNASVKMAEKISFEDHQVHLSFAIELNQRREFIFVGNRFFTNIQLLKALTIFGRSASLLPESALKQELTLLYKTKGFFDTKVETKEETGRTFFIIDEGARSRLSSIAIHGCTQYTSEYLIKEYCSECLNNSLIDQVQINKAFAAIVALYADKGFLDARIAKYEYQEITNVDTRNLLVTIDEGSLYTITSTHVQGMPEYSNQGPFARCNSGQQVPFTTEEMCRQREWLIKELSRDTHCLVNIRPHVERDGAAIRIIWHRGTEQSTCFGKTVIIGIQTLPFECIMRELVYKEGDTWEQDKLKKSMKSLRALGTFNTVYLHPDNTNDDTQGKTIIASLQMDDPYEVRMRGGLGLQQVSHEFNFLGFTYRAGGTFLFKNPLNSGDQFSCEVDFAKYDTKIVATYRRPWLFRLPLSSLFQIYHSRQSHPGIIKSSENLYQVTQQGFMSTVSYAHTHGTLGVNIGIEYMETSTADAAGQSREVANALARAINFAPQLLDKKVPYFLLEPTILIDRLDNNLQPTKGTFTLISLKGMLPLGNLGGRSYFVRCSLEQSFFIPMRKVVAAFRMRLGHIFHDSFRTIMPTERFYLGGAHSIRSYDMDFAPPLGIFKDASGVLHCVPRGGKSMANLNIELRMPFYKRIGFVLFQDLGGLSADSLAAIERENILAATGGGIRYDTVFGPLRFDIGWKWRRSKPCDAPFAWFLTLGQAF